MTDRERIVEVMAEGFYTADDAYLDTWDSQPEEGVKEWYRDKAPHVLAALEAAGYAWYRPDDCETVCVRVEHTDWGMPYLCGFDAEEEIHHWQHGHKPEMARLVPVGGDS